MMPKSFAKASLEQINEAISWLDNMIVSGEMRRHPRKPVKLKGHYVIKNISGFVPDSKFKESPVQIVDISKKGAGVLSNRPMSVGEKFTVLCLSTTSKVAFDLKVVRNSKLDGTFRYGCEMSTFEKIAG
jgi:hypothetical protein